MIFTAEAQMRRVKRFFRSSLRLCASAVSLIIFILTSCTSPPAAPAVVNFKEGVIAVGDPLVPAFLLPTVKTSKVRLNNVVRNAVEVRAGQPLVTGLFGRVRMAVGVIPGTQKAVTFTVSRDDKTEKLTVTPDQGWVELDLTFPSTDGKVTVSTDAPSGAYVANPRSVLVGGPYRLAGLFIIDALRADALGVYGATGNPSPNIDAFAERSAVFTRAHTASSFTLTSVASILTGLWPWQHGVIFSEDAGLMLSPEVPTLVENFRAAGWHTAAFSGTYFSLADNGLARGFDVMDESCADKFFEGSADCLASRVKAFLEEHADEPVFIYVHFVDTHAPYNPPEPFRSRFTRGLTKPTDEDTARGDTNQFEESRKLWQLFRKPSPTDLAWLRGLYQGEVAYVDDRMGPVLDFIREKCPDQVLPKLGENQTASIPEYNCAVAISADHGDSFAEHGAMGHIADIHEPVFRVPLIVYQRFQHKPEPTSLDLLFGGFGMPRIGRYDDEARSIDIMPVLMSLSSLTVPETIAGNSLGKSNFGDYRSLILHQPAAGLHFVKGKKEYALVMWPWKIFYRPDTNVTSLYNLDADPGETSNQAGRQPEKVKELMAELTRQLSLPPPGGTKSIPTDPDTLKRLRNLGYINK